MMEELQYYTEDYRRGFNEGYTVAAYLTELAGSIAQSVGVSSRSQGFKDGREELIIEKTRERYPEWLKQDWAKEQELDKDYKNPSLEKDRGDYEPD